MTLFLLIFLLQAHRALLTPYGFTNVATPVPPAPTEFGVTAFPKRACLEWTCPPGAWEFEIKIVRDGVVQPKIVIRYPRQDLTNFNWIDFHFSGATNIYSVRRLQPESEWSGDITVTH